MTDSQYLDIAFIVYALGCSVCALIYAKEVHKIGEFRVADLNFCIFIALFSWLSVLLYASSKIVEFLDKHIDGNKILWKRKDKEVEK